MRNYGKYTFDTVDEATQLISALEENNHLIVKLGYIELEPAIYDEDGEEVLLLYILINIQSVSYTHLTLPTIYSV